MKKFLLFAVMYIPVTLEAQGTLTSDLIEGGRTLIDLIKVIRVPKPAIAATSYNSIDSCSIKKRADISFKNRTDKMMAVTIYLRNGNTYEIESLSMKVAPLSQESLYEVRAGIYKYKIESDSAGQRTLLHEGDLKLRPCDKLVKQIKG